MQVTSFTFMYIGHITYYIYDIYDIYIFIYTYHIYHIYVYIYIPDIPSRHPVILSCGFLRYVLGGPST